MFSNRTGLSAMTILTSGAIAIPCYLEITRKPDGTTDASSTKAGSILFSCRSEFFAFELKVGLLGFKILHWRALCQESSIPCGFLSLLLLFGSEVPALVRMSHLAFVDSWM